MLLLVHVDDGIVGNVFLYSDDDNKEAERIQKEIAENDCPDPAVQYVSMYQIKPDGRMGELISTLPEEDFNEDDDSGE